MSTILKALRRLETERQGQDERALRGQVVSRPAARGGGGRLRAPLVAASGVAGAALVVGAFAWWTAPPAPAPDVPPRPAPAARLAAPPAPAPRVAVRDAPAPEPVARRTAPAARPAAATVVPEPPRAAPRAVAAPAPVAAPPAEPVAPPPPVAVVTDPSPGPEATPAPASPAPSAAPEVAARTSLPRVVVDRTVWHPRAERRLAILDVEGRAAPVELREGDAVGDLVVLQIDPGGVVFLHRGIEIRRRIGN